ncbi:sugar ABC transporter substrate-binding protein [Falsibacillus albus]|uniref:Extracellular solute-binding protein n=1 Tax=Falsibacillus albus TaxID=2478915 RepID=A0A3L7K7B3_9BACI|nr:sugar ABC transporter substrate-binding protein [Falsibacillus albus]RLQ96612.1 extracellular solute-binding protein [Falsibacillus albus]
MKKSLALLFVCIMALASVLGGCSGGSDDKNTLTVWAMGEEGKKLNQLAKKFEKENPDIHVKVQAIPWASAHDKLLTAVASQKGPDVLQLGTTWVPEFADAGALKDLTPYLDKYPNFKPDNYFDGAVQTMKSDGKIISIPWYVETRVLFYRKDLLKDAGYDQAPATWDELKDAATKLAARGGKNLGIDIDRKDQITPFIFAWQNGYDFKMENGKGNFDDPKFKEAMKYYSSFFKEGLSSTTDGVDIVQAFKDGQKPMFISGPWMIKILNDQAPDLKGKWSVAVLPKKETNTSSIGGANFSVFNSSKHVDQALKFINYVSKVDTQLDWLKISDALPSRKEAWNDPALKDDPMFATFGEQLKNTKTSPQIKEWEAVAQDLIDALEKVNVGGADLDKEMKDFEKKANDALKK